MIPAFSTVPEGMRPSKIMHQHLYVGRLRTAVCALRAWHATKAAKGWHKEEVGTLWIERTYNLVAEQIVQEAPFGRVDLKATHQVAQPGSQAE